MHFEWRGVVAFLFNAPQNSRKKFGHSGFWVKGCGFGLVRFHCRQDSSLQATVRMSTIELFTPQERPDSLLSWDTKKGTIFSDGHFYVCPICPSPLSSSLSHRLPFCCPTSYVISSYFFSYLWWQQALKRHSEGIHKKKLEKAAKPNKVNTFFLFMPQITQWAVYRKGDWDGVKFDDFDPQRYAWYMYFPIVIIGRWCALHVSKGKQAEPSNSVCS